MRRDVKRKKTLIQFATKKDISLLRSETDVFKKHVDGRFKKLERHVDQKMDEIKRHFDVVAENIHQDVLGVTKDVLSLLRTKTENHEQRITALEER